jgi:hypothetical protein
MPTKRRKIPPRRLRQRSDWVERYLATGEEPPDDGGRDRDEFLGWLFFDEPIPGLPAPWSDEWRNLLAGRNAD